MAAWSEVSGSPGDHQALRKPILGPWSSTGGSGILVWDHRFDHLSWINAGTRWMGGDPGGSMSRCWLEALRQPRQKQM